MVPVSVVIITKNEADVIASCINAAKLITNDVVVVDNGSTDGTREIAYACGCKVFSENWDGYGANKNKGISQAKHDWILSIDADEIPGAELIRSLHRLKYDKPEMVYDIAFRSYYGHKRISFGTWGRDHHIRLFNRKLVRWSEPPVHETLVLSPLIITKKLKGYMDHYSIKDKEELFNKTVHYANLSAGKYLISGKKATALKLYAAPVFHFIKNYILFLGFLDGREGWQIAKMITKLTWLKYRLLKNKTGLSHHEKGLVEEAFVMEY